MSLINEALKKAQRLRQEEPAPGSPAPEAAPTDRVIKRSPPRNNNTMILLVVGGVVLVVLSVVATVFLLNRSSDTPVAPVASNAIPAPVLPSDAPEIPPPVIIPTESIPAANAVPEPVPLLPEPIIIAAAPPQPVPVVPLVPAAAPQPDPRIAAFVEAIRVAGIRSSGNESRVLMNERVYRVNDLVDRTLNIRLTQVEADTLTFADANDFLYVKKF